MKLPGWLLAFYSVPSMPANNRIKIWRKLARAGAIPLKGAVYILPYSEEHYELFQWLISEVSSMGGEGDFVRVEHVETMKDLEIINLFNKQRESKYRNIEKGLDGLERKISSIKKGGRGQNKVLLLRQIDKIMRGYEEVRRIDFFLSKAGSKVEERIRDIRHEIDVIFGTKGDMPVVTVASIPQRRIRDYRKKLWITRKAPFIDRIASAWLIKRFIDKEASFDFMDEKEIGGKRDNMVTFDVRGGEFTHAGDMCTFEVILKAFGLKDKALKKIAEIVHELDMKDDKYKNPESRGIEELLRGLIKTAKGDTEVLEKGMAVFEMLYASKG